MKELKLSVIGVSQKTCYGCGACVQSCPQNCIIMKEDSEGFYIPKIKNDDCINCGLCISKCPLEKELSSTTIQEVYAVKQKNLEILMDSTSGGVFHALSSLIIKNNGYVFGCSWSEELVAIHKKVSSQVELNSLHGSKYVQSEIGNTFKLAKELLDENKYVLYSGTACQIAGLKLFLGKEYDNLYTLDIICHGVPSPLLFKKYLSWLSKKYKNKILSYDFRSKEKTAWGLTYKAKTKTKTKFLNAHLDPYYNAFLECKTYRECCYNCKYASKNRVSDITLGDYWGIEKKHPEFFDDKGVSVVIVNSPKGKELFREISDQINYIVSSYEKAAENNDNLNHPSNRHPDRSKIYQNIFDVSAEEIFNVRLKIGMKLTTRIKAIIPYKIKKRLKKYK